MVSQKHPKGCLLGTRLAKGCYIDTPYFHVVNKTPCIAWRKVTPRGKCGEIMINMYKYLRIPHYPFGTLKIKGCLFWFPPPLSGALCRHPFGHGQISNLPVDIGVSLVLFWIIQGYLPIGFPFFHIFSWLKFPARGPKKIIEAAATRSRSSHLGPGAVAPVCLDPTGREDDGPPVEGTEQDSSRRVSESTKMWKTWNICHQHLMDFWGTYFDLQLLWSYQQKWGDTDWFSFFLVIKQ